MMARNVILWEVYLLWQGSLTGAQNAVTLIGPALLGCVLPCTPSRDRLEASWDLLAELLAKRGASSQQAPLSFILLTQQISTCALQV